MVYNRERYYKNIVYLIKLNRDKLPNKYIGSKSNCYINDGKIYDKNDKLYIGSSCDKEYKNLFEYLDFNVHVLGVFESYDECLEKEKQLHIKYDVVASPEFFNKSIACISNFSDPNYATYKHNSGKIARLPRNHPRVLSGEWYGITKGISLSEERKEKIRKDMLGSKNPFYGKKHTDETKQTISNTNLGRKRTEEFKLNMSKRFKGISKTKEHRRKIGRKGLCMLQNTKTGENIRIKIEEQHLYDTNIWKNPSSIKQRRETCIYCGKESVAGNIKRWHNENCKEKR